MVISRSGCATWIAASPMPGASYMVSNMSSASLRISVVTFSTGLEISRSCLSGRMMISLKAIAARFKLLICRGQCADASVKAALTMIFKTALTTKIKPSFTINVPSSFAKASGSATSARMNEILLIVGDLPIHAGEALIGFGALALLLLLVIAIVIARSGRRGAELAMAQAICADELEERLSVKMLRAQSEIHRPGRRDGAGAGGPPARDDARGQRAAGFGDAPGRPIDGSDHAPRHGQPARAA